MKRKVTRKKERENRDYAKGIVLVHDCLIASRTDLKLFGVALRKDEIHLEFYFRRGNRTFHRDIELQRSGSYDSGTFLPDLRGFIDRRVAIQHKQRRVNLCCKN